MSGQEKKTVEDACSVLQKFRNCLTYASDGNGTAEEELDILLWEVLDRFQGRLFHTAKNLEFTYSIRGGEMFVSRKDKSLTKATVLLAFHNALAIQAREGSVAGPKKLKTFGASYLYPVFLWLGVIRTANSPAPFACPPEEER